MGKYLVKNLDIDRRDLEDIISDTLRAGNIIEPSESLKYIIEKTNMVGVVLASN